MTSTTSVGIDAWDPDSTGDRAAVAAMLLAYHRQTEQEKGASPDELTARYRAEIDDPLDAFTGSTVLVARDRTETTPADALGMLVLAPAGDGWFEVKRLWVEPSARGRGTARALLRAAAERAEGQGAGLRLSVWEWRGAALALYETMGFRRVPSWDPRPGLVCLERAGTS
ncbi:GNAT family N-acetyltransferase [Herbiconiux sp. CPCC 205716]|uniref:GNAT family N-acetyltransferase n=1 Tax=Herbiconiux gentiana TaxID=2970912 RepID=A0ABT2GB36_9MICO|nr:GNAT family N-acetyltransferase [Herbiconiux gentiana]MCS5713410.1 GNAT family N-acetyltransferase [Herbiconiux gentiana]